MAFYFPFVIFYHLFILNWTKHCDHLHYVSMANKRKQRGKKITTSICRIFNRNYLSKIQLFLFCANFIEILGILKYGPFYLMVLIFYWNYRLVYYTRSINSNSWFKTSTIVFSCTQQSIYDNVNCSTKFILKFFL